MVLTSYPRAGKESTAQQPYWIGVFSSLAPELIWKAQLTRVLTAAGRKMLQRQQPLQADTVGMLCEECLKKKADFVPTNAKKGITLTATCTLIRKSLAHSYDGAKSPSVM